MNRHRTHPPASRRVRPARRPDLEPLEPRTLLSGSLDYILTPTDFTPANGLLLFTGDDGVHGPELWRSDGSPAGTYLLADIRRGPSGSRPVPPGAIDYDFPATRQLLTLGRYTYFAASSRSQGLELWRTDGTTPGTTLVRDLNPGRSGSLPASLAVYKGNLYVAAADADPVNYEETNQLWKTDGAATPSFALVSRAVHRIFDLTVAGNYLFFQNVTADGTTEIWRSDGTTAGTVRLNLGLNVTSDSFPYQPQLQLRAAGNQLFIFDGHNGALWRVDPASAALTRISDGGTYVGTLNNRLLYSVYTSGTSYYYDPPILQLFATDGTTAGTVEIWEGETRPDAQPNFTVVGNTLYFNAQPLTYEPLMLWKSDGTPAGTKAVKETGFDRLDPLSTFGGVGSTLYFAVGPKLWKSDGSAAGTTAVADLPTPASAGPSDLHAAALTGVAATGRLFFLGLDDARGVELYTYRPGTQPLRLRTVAPAATLAAGVLTVSGTDADDTIRLTAAGNTLTLLFNDEPAQTFPLNTISAIVVNAGTGDDTVTLAGPVPHPTVYGGDGDDTLTAGDSPALLQGDDGADSLTGGPADDRLYGGDFRDTIRGGAGNDDCYGDDPANADDGGDWEDTLAGGPGRDVLSGGASRGDTADYSDRGDDLDVRLDGRARDGAPGERDNVLADVENVIGGWGSDHFVGNAADNTFFGYRGDDTLEGAEGDDQLYGGRGDDRLFGNSGDDTLNGDLGADTLDGAKGNDRFLATDPTPTRDRLFGGPGEDEADYDDRDRLFDIEVNLLLRQYE